MSRRKRDFPAHPMPGEGLFCFAGRIAEGDDSEVTDKMIADALNGLDSLLHFIHAYQGVLRARQEQRRRPKLALVKNDALPEN